MDKVRLDVFLAREHRHYSRTHIKKLIEEGFVLVDGGTRKPGFLLRGGEKIEMVRRAPEIPEAEPENIPLEILYEDEDLMAINKPAGIVVHPAPGNFTGTIVNAVLFHLGRVGEGLRPGIVHRLDKGTSGVMVIAKNDQTLRSLSQQFKDRKTKKVYHALVFGSLRPKTGRIATAIGRDASHRRKFSSKTHFAREAVTQYRVLQEFSGLSLLEVRPETGRTHQIRVHLSENKHPIVGDTLYGAKSFLSSIKDASALALLESVDRPLLHAQSLKLTHPATRQEVSFESPWPQDLKSLVAALGGTV